MRLYVLIVAMVVALAGCSGDNPQAAEQKPAPAAKPELKPEPKPEEQLPDKATAVFDTTAGKLTCELFPQQTPKTVANFIQLAEGTKNWVHPASRALKRNTPLYDGTIFHRIIPNFMIQGGDPAGNGTGDPGFRFEDEIVPSLKFDKPGRLAMANSGPNTNGSQFFITEVPTPHLNGRHTIFGQCDAASVALVKSIARRGRDMRTDRPNTPVKINKVIILRGEAEPQEKETEKPAEKSAPPAAPKKTGAN